MNTHSTRLHLPPSVFRLVALLFLLGAPAVSAGVTVFFDPSQAASLVTNGVTSDTISSEGYVFTYTRDKLFTGGVGLTNPIGRPVRVAWPDGLEAQYVTAGPAPAKASITVRRQDGAVFDLSSFTAKLLANAGAGRAIEIVPLLNGEEVLNDPLVFDVSGNYGNQFSYDQTPNYLGSTATLTNYDTYIINLTLDYALTALTLESAAPGLNHAPSDLALAPASVTENKPAATVVGAFTTTDPDAGDSFTYTLVPGVGSEGNSFFSLVGGDLLTAVSFNYEAQAGYTLRVRSTDQSGLWVEAVVNVSVSDMAEPRPQVDSPEVSTSGAAVLHWSSIPNHVYTLHGTTNLAGGFSMLQDGIPATPPVNTYTDNVTGVAAKYWKVSTPD